MPVHRAFPLPLQTGAPLPLGALLIAAALVVAFLSPILFAIIVFFAYDESSDSPNDARDSDEADRNLDRETDSDHNAGETMI